MESRCAKQRSTWSWCPRLDSVTVSSFKPTWIISFSYTYGLRIMNSQPVYCTMVIHKWWPIYKMGKKTWYHSFGFIPTNKSPDLAFGCRHFWTDERNVKQRISDISSKKHPGKQILWYTVLILNECYNTCMYIHFLLFDTFPIKSP